MPDKIARLWHRWSWLCHLLGLSFVGGMIWMGISDTQATVAEHNTKIISMQETIVSTRQDVATIKESLRWIEKALGRH